MVHLDGHTLEFEDLSTQELVQIIATDDWAALLPGALIYTDRIHIIQRLADLDDELSFSALHQITRKIITSLTGTTPHAAKLLANLVIGAWFPFDAWCVVNNFDPSTAPLHRIISAAYAYAISTCTDKKKTDQLIAKLFPPDQQEHSAADEHALMAGVMSNAAMSEDGRLVT